jgi:hypothetical protein
MIIDVLTWNIGTTYDGSWAADPGGTTIITAGSTIIVKLDDTTGQLTAWKNGTIQLLAGPNLFFGYNGSASLSTVAPFYQYCQGTVLRQVGTSSNWPYGTLGSNSNNSECQIAPTCDLEISSFYTITPATGPSAADGSIVGSGTTSNGIPKYSFDPNFDYGEPYERFPLPALEDWVVVNTSSEPMVWTDGIPNPILTLTGTTIQPTPVSDWLSVIIPFETGELYKYKMQFTLFSDQAGGWPSGRYVTVTMQILTAFDIVLESKTYAGYASPSGTVVGVSATPWQFIMPANAFRLVVFVTYQFAGIVPNNDYVVINYFDDISGTADAPGVQKELNFTGLLPGQYTLYSKDSIGCQDSISFEIPVTTVSDVKYRLEFSDMLVKSSKNVRLDILERDYVGPILEIWGGDHPITIRYEGDRDDANGSFIPSNCVLKLLVRTAGEFTEMLQSDDRKYRVNHYMDNGSGLELYWTGYVIPEFHSEPYIFEPYYLEVTCSDQLGELKDEPFEDVNGNNFKGDLKAIKIIAEILKKTGLSLNIRCGINVFDIAMDPDGDPLDQAYIDSRIYYNEKKIPDSCDEVIKSIMDSFRAQFFQSQGVWWIIRLSDAVGAFAYREFDSEGDLLSDGAFDPLIELDSPGGIHAAGKAMFANKNQLLTFLRNYGRFSVSHDLKKDGNLIDSGRFELEDIILLGSGNVTFQDWNVLIGQPGVKYGHETVVNGDSTGAFYFDFTSAGGAQTDTQLYSAVMPLDNQDGKIRFKFQYFITPAYVVPYIRIAWTLKFRKASDGTFIWVTYATNGALTYAFIEAKNDIYVTSFDQWNTFDLLADIPNIGLSDGFEISFFFHNHHGRDYSSITDFKAFDLSSLPNPNGVKRMVAEEPTQTNIYVSEWSADAESIPDVVRPDNYIQSDGTYGFLWRLEKIVPLGEFTSLVIRTKFDNVSLAFYPQVIVPTTEYIDPPETLVYSEEVDEFVKPSFSREVLLGDMIRFHDTQFRNERYLYRSYLRLSDGTPTTQWARAGVDEGKKLLQILLEDYVAQFSLPQRRLSGTKITTRVMHFVNCLRDNIDGTRYRPMTFEFDVKNAMYTPDMAGVVAGEDGEPPYAPGAFESDAFSNGFSIGN